MSWTVDLFAREVRFAILGSGSTGNAAVIWSGDDAVLVDCGLSARRVLDGLGQLGLSARQLRAVLLTHEHADHVGGVDVLARRLRLPVYCTDGTRRGLTVGNDIELRTLVAGRAIRVGALDVESFRVPHDTGDPVGFIVGVGVHRVGFATDMGSVRPSVVKALRTCRAVILEFNHDLHMLRHGTYPGFLKDRVESDRGHLSNRQASALLAQVLEAGSRVEHVLLAHLSEQNNRPELALAAARHALAAAGREPRLDVLEAAVLAGPFVLSDRG